MVRTLILLFAIAVIGAQFGCGASRPFSSTNGQDYNLINPTSNTYDPDMSPVSTGSTKKFKNPNGTLSEPVPYTPAGATDEFQKMQQELQNTSDKFMAEYVQKVEVSLLDGQSRPIQIDHDPVQPAKIRVAIKFDPKSVVEPKELDFAAELLLGADVLSAHCPSTTNDLPGLLFSADILCLDLACNNIEIRVHKHLRDLTGTVSPALSDIGIFYRETYPKVSVQKARDTKTYEDPTLQSLQQLPVGVSATRSSVSVVDGPSYSRIQVPNASSATDDAQKKYAVQIDTDLTDTGSVSGQVNDVITPQSNSKIEGELVGNNPNTGSLIVDLKQPTTNEVTRLRIVEPIKTQAGSAILPKIISDEILFRADSKQLVPTPNDSTQLPQATKVSQGLALHASENETQRLIQVWLGKEKDRKTCRSEATPDKLEAILKYGPPVLPYVAKIAEAIDVTPEIAYILPLESDYLTNPARPTGEVGHMGSEEPHSGATTKNIGPWMIDNDTADFIKKISRLNFNILPVLNGTADPLDDRTYFLNSTYMAAHNFKYLFAKFQADPAIAILAYRAGIGRAGGLAQAAAVYEKFDITLEDILEHHVASIENCVYINYVYTYLALRTIGQNLDLYDKKPDLTTTTVSKQRFKSAKGPLPRGL